MVQQPQELMEIITLILKVLQRHGLYQPVEAAVGAEDRLQMVLVEVVALFILMRAF